MSDEKGGQDDKRCVMEARLEGRQPIAVTHHAQTMDQAVNGAAGKLHRMIDSVGDLNTNVRTREAPAA